MSFTIKCDKCNSEDIRVSVNAGEYENEVYITCNNCENEVAFYC